MKPNARSVLTALGKIDHFELKARTKWDAGSVFLYIPEIFPFKLDSETGFPGIPDFFGLAKLAPVKYDGYANGMFLDDCFETTHSETNTEYSMWCEMYKKILSRISLHVLFQVAESFNFFSPKKFLSKKTIFPPWGFAFRWWRRVMGQCFRNTWEALWSITNLGVRSLDAEGEVSLHARDSERACCWLVNSKRVES